MSLPLENARRLARSTQLANIRNLIAQTKAKQVLREVHEVADNFPRFEPDLDDRVTFVAYALLAAGCSLVERGETIEGHAELYAAADILEAAHRTEIRTVQASALHCLIGAMAFYACGQYSRAFVLIKNVEEVTPSAAVVAAFLRKDLHRLISRLNAVLIADEPEFEDARDFDDWVLTTCLARAVSLVAEHSISGDSELLANADAVLRDAMAIGEGDSNPPLWWLARLLRLMFKDYGNGSLWLVLPPHFGPDGVAQVDAYVKLLALMTPPVSELWQSQIAALRLALDSTNHGGVINLRTSAGKTRVAELAILHTLRDDPTAKVLYLAPFRSLAFELERTFSRTLAPLGFHVSHLYGGLRFSGVDRELVNDGHITIATPEKAKAMLRAAPELFDAVKLIVIDEGHLLGGNQRNVRNELFLEHLRLLGRPRSTRILLLSAVLPNAGDLAAWVGGDENALVKSNWKPSAERFGTLRWKQTGVSIEWLGGQRCFNPHFVEFKEVPKGKGQKTRSFPATKTEAVAAAAVRLAELGPVLIFAGQARWVPSMAVAVLLAYGPNPPAHIWPTTEWRIFEAVCKEELGDDSFLLSCARIGVICHSNKLPPQVRISIEKLMAKCPPRIIVATTTLGQGVNIGVSSVIIATTSIGKGQIRKRDFWNICGRAGRAFVDGEGKVLFAVDMTGKPWQVRMAEQAARDYFDLAHLDDVQSGLLQVLAALRMIAARVNVPFELLLELAANDDFSQLGTDRGSAEGLLDWIDDHLLALHVAYNGDDPTQAVDWVDDAFRSSLARLQESRVDNQRDELIPLLKARAIGVVRKVSSPAARRTIVASGLPLSVGLRAFEQVDYFREVVDRYLNGDAEVDALGRLVLAFETWARESAQRIAEKIPAQDMLDQVRPQWLAGTTLRQIVDTAGDAAVEICTNLYGYQLPWLFHAVAQTFDRSVEEERVEALASVGLFVELGLPNESAAKVFLAGVRSRTAAVELAAFVTDSTASVSRIRKALLDPAIVIALSNSVSPSTLEWLKMLDDEQGEVAVSAPIFPRFRLEAPEEVNMLHVRRVDTRDDLYLCSTDARFKFAVQSTEELPFREFANDPRFVFSRKDNTWVQECRDPRISLASQ